MDRGSRTKTFIIGGSYSFFIAEMEFKPEVGWLKRAQLAIECGK